MCYKIAKTGIHGRYTRQKRPLEYFKPTNVHTVYTFYKIL